MRSKKLIFFSLCVAVALFFTADIMLGSVWLSPGEVWNALIGGGDPVSRTLVHDFRLPKAIVALLAGMALSVSGLQMQTMFRNPLAGPYVLGISSGASLGVSLLLLGAPMLAVGAAGGILREMGVAVAAWAGAALVLALVMAAAIRIKDIMAVLILGMMFGSAATAVVEILQFLSPDSAVKSFVVWTMGSLGGVSAPQLKVMAVCVGAGLLLSVMLIKSLNLLLLGEGYARTMGLNVITTRALMFTSTILLAGTVTAFCGPIGFLGIAVPHVARMIFMEADHKVLLPGSLLIGAAMMLLCDIIAQLPGSEAVLPINTITALFGIPIVVLIIIRNRKIF